MGTVMIVSAVRTAIGSYGGSLKGTSAVELGKAVMEEALVRAGVPGNDVDEVMFGCVLQSGQGQNVARQCSLGAGMPVEVPAMTINMVCGSGLRTVSLGAATIKAEDSRVVVAGGTENMSQAPYILDQARFGYRMGHNQMKDVMITDGLWDAFNDYHMGVTAENIATELAISRERQDRFAVLSQNKAEVARAEGKFKEEILPLELKGRKGKVTVFDEDEYIREGCLVDQLQRLKPAFQKEGTVTAGNASGINDGAAAFVLAEEAYVEEKGLKPMAKILSYASSGVEPVVMGLGPVEAVRKALDKAGLTKEDIGLFELNEAFAAQSLGVIESLGLSEDNINVNGGAIALGHPIGASGARILVTLLHEMKKQKVRYGLASLCIGGGMGTAVVVENMMMEA